MKNKILIQLSVPNIAMVFDLYIPINERIDKVIELLVQGINDITDQDLDLSKQFVLMDAVNGSVYDNTIIVRDTKMRNGSKVLLIQI